MGQNPSTRVRALLSGNRTRTLSVAVPLLRALAALVRKKPKRAAILLVIALISSRSTKLGTVAQILHGLLGRRR